ncbi:hypothetical protein D9757_007725 [Collybiopsis confluens]|uniref:Uncharacterized protein n=1 Tax=Collybiopsis confluens TaxID=2823264 RepID=A0A8H5H5D3_9AGAR|nr:hypothetical protein D9757_007725 [Collybiopsis confluens]
MHALSVAAIVLSLSAHATLGYVVPRKEAPSTYAEGYLEPYQQYHTRYLAIGCQFQHNNATFFNACCHPMLATETLDTARPSFCRPSASSSASAAQATSSSDDSDDDEDDDCDDQSSSTPAPSITSQSTSAIPSSSPKPTSTHKPKPTPTPTSTKQPERPAPTSSPAAQPKSNTGSTDTATGSSEVFTGGFATFFYQNGVAGACGTVHSDNDLIVAIDQQRYGNSGARSQFCGKTVSINGKGKTVNAVVADDCPTCAKYVSSILLSVCKFIILQYSSGRPYTTPKGHSPQWTSKVTWLKGSAKDPSSFSDALSETHGVVHTLGTLFEDAGKYKRALREGDIPKVIGSALSSIFDSQNPLGKGGEGSYEDINRDSALRVCETFMSCGEGKKYPSPRPFVYISAEDVFRPFIPARYIETKREAENGIEAMLSKASPNQFRGVYVRPSLVYHAHYRPLTTPAAAALDLSFNLHRKIPPGLPTPSHILRRLGAALSLQSSPMNEVADLGSPLDSIANAMTIPPIHVDHVAEAIAIVLVDDAIKGVVGVQRMRELMGWWPESHPEKASQPT